jgi:hypothetical protein
MFMKKLIYCLTLTFFFSLAVFSQKGIDTQTKKIKEEGGRSTQSTGVGGRSINWGKEKTKVRALLANPYKMNSRRDVLINQILEVLKDNKFIVDESASRFSDGIIVTEPYVFAKGAVISRSELSRYADIPNSDSSWTSGRYTFIIEVQSIDGIQNNVSVRANVEGKSRNGLSSEWTTLQSRGVAEDEYLSKLVELVTGISPDAPQDIDPQ